jgi:hypothetical protein
MDLWDWFKSWISRETTRPTAVLVPRDNIAPKPDATPLKANVHYVRLLLREMCLDKDREWFTGRLPAVHALIVLKFGDKKLELASVAGRSRLSIDTPDLARSKFLTHELTGLLPFKGGSVQIDCGLASMKNTDLISSFIDVVSDFASKLTLPQVASAADIAGSVAKSVQGLLGAGDAASKLYYHEEFFSEAGGQELKPGYIFISEKRDGTLPPNQVWVQNGEVWLGPANDKKRADPHDYMLIQIASSESRSDWRDLTTIATPFNAAIEAKLSGDMAKATALINQALMAAFNSPDLAAEDAKRIMISMRKYYDDPLGGGSASESAALQHVERAAARGPTIAQARGLKAFTIDTLPYASA